MATDAAPPGPPPAALSVIDQLAGEFLAHQPDLFESRTVLDWMKLLADVATLHPTDWFGNLPLVLLARELAQRQSVESLNSVEELEYARLFDSILNTLQSLPASMCYAARRDGTYCGHRPANGLFYCLQHRRHGILSLARDGEKPTGRPDAYTCFTCARSATDHPCDSTRDKPDALHCYTCLAAVATQCAVNAAGRDLDPTTPIQCSVCAEHRARFGLLLSTCETAAGDPACPDYVVLPVHPGLLPAAMAVQAPATSPADVGQPAGATTAQPQEPSPRAPSSEPLATGAPVPPAQPPPPSTETTDLLRSLVAAVQDLREEIRRAPPPATATPVCPPSSGAAQAPTTPEPTVELTSAAELLTASGERPHPWGNVALATRIGHFAGRKNNVDAAGNLISSPLNFLSTRYGEQNDYLANCTTGTGATNLELHGYCGPTVDGVPDQLGWETYLANYISWHWRLLHVIDSPAFDQATPEGRLRTHNVLTVIVRCRYLYALSQALRYRVEGRPELRWADIFAYLKRYVAALYTSRPITVYDQFFPKILAEQERLLRDGAPSPTFHDELEQQLIAAARGHLQTSFLPPVAAEAERPKPKLTCALCLGAHRTSAHPENAPITQPCPKCGRLHTSDSRSPSPAEHAAIGSPLPAWLLARFGPEGSLLLARTSAALGVHLPPDYADANGIDLLPTYSRSGPGYLKLMMAQLAAGLGLTSARQRVSDAELWEFLQEIHLVRRRFHSTQRRLIELGVREGAAPVLTLSVAPRDPRGWLDWYEVQATARDSAQGVYTPGVRVNTERLLMCPHVPSDLKAQLLEGTPLLWTGRPPRYDRRNYASCYEHGGVSGADFDRLHANGWVEGPLPYKPWIVNPIACILKLDPYKVRNVVDYKRSGVNEYLARVPCELDDLHSALSGLRPGDGVAKIDLADAFFCWPVAAADADYCGFRHPTTGEYYRYRFTSFGHRQAPALQQRWARVVREIIVREGLKYCRPETPESCQGNIRVPGTYLDDFFLRLSYTLTPWQQALMYNSVLCVLAEYGFPVKISKNEWPGTRGEFLGVTVDTVRGTVSIAAARCTKLLRALDSVLSVMGGTGTVSRGVLASFIGKVQWVCPVVRAGQAHLVHLYAARDAVLRTQPSAQRRHQPHPTPTPTFNGTSTTTQAKRVPSTTNPTEYWDPDAPCLVGADAISDLYWWRELLVQGSVVPAPRAGDPLLPLERSYVRAAPAYYGLWARQLLPRLPADSHLRFDGGMGFEVITSDASGWAGGVWWRHRRLHYAFTPEQLAAGYAESSNLRELFMVPWTISQLGEELRGSTALFRLDNTAAVGAVNKGASSTRTVLELLLWLLSLLQVYDIELVARHIPGVRNVLADTISRLKGEIDYQDWQLLRSIFVRLESSVGPFEVDACSDVLGRNAYCDYFWSEADSCLQHDWAGRRVYCNPPFAFIHEILAHFWRCYQRAPADTSATFVLPTWFRSSWWRLLGGAQVVAHFGRGADLFTSPEWRTASRTNPVPRTRAARGPTNWGVVLIHVPPAAPMSRYQPAGNRNLPRLSGDGVRDAVLLRKLPDGFVSEVRAQA